MNFIIAFALTAFSINLLGILLGLIAIRKHEDRDKYTVRLEWHTLGLYVLVAVNIWFVLITGYVSITELLHL